MKGEADTDLRGKIKGFGLYLIIILLLLSAVSYMLSMGNRSQEVPYSDVVALFEEERVQAFDYNDGTNG